jgi:hypothetical protein
MHQAKLHWMTVGFLYMYAYCLHNNMPIKDISAQQTSINNYFLFIAYSVITGFLYNGYKQTDKGGAAKSYSIQEEYLEGDDVQSTSIPEEGVLCCK